MNFNTYGFNYGAFHRCSISFIQHDIITFDLAHSQFETWTVSRMYPYESIVFDSKKPLLMALKSFFKLDVTASVISNSQYNWTICMGKQIIYPVSREVKPKTKLHIYATPFFVQNPQAVSQYLQGTVKPVYDNVYFYKNTILYLDDEDLPYPGGYYFDQVEPTGYYRICFVSNESIDYVANLAAEWKSRREVLTIPFMSRVVTAKPKFINFQQVSDIGVSNLNVWSTGIIQRKLSSKKPEHIIQDVLVSYYKNKSRYATDEKSRTLTSLGLFIEWPAKLIFEHSKPNESRSEDRKFVALSINGNSPNRVVYALHPYDRYVEYDNVPATIWSPISFVFSTFVTDVNVKKVTLDTVVVGLVYREMFFCLSEPLLEGTPTKDRVTNGQYLLSLASMDVMKSDPNFIISASFKYDDRYSLRRVYLKNVSLETWCVTTVDDTNPHSKNFRLPYLVTEWLNFFTQVRKDAFDVDVSIVRLALTLSKHNICYNLIESSNPVEQPIILSDNKINFYANERVVQFINEARIIKFDETENKSSQCIIN